METVEVVRPVAAPRPSVPVRRRVAGPTVLPGRRLPPVVVPVAVFAVSRVLVWAMAWWSTTAARLPGRGPWPRLPERTGVLAALSRWDTAWYLQLSGRGYPPSPRTGTEWRHVAFYPELPALLRGVSRVTGLSPMAAGVVVGLAGGLAAVLAVWFLTRELAGTAAANRAAALLSFFPAAFVFSMAYTEGLAIAAAAAALLLAHRRRWVAAGLVGALATAARPNTVVLVVALAVAAWLATRRPVDAADGADADGVTPWLPWAAPVLASFGVAVVWASLWSRTGHPTAWLRAEERGWGDAMDFGASTVSAFWRVFTSATPHLGDLGLVDVAKIAGVVLAVGGVVLLLRWRPPLPVTVFGVASVAMAATSTVVGPRPRMVLGAFPLVMAMGVEVRGRRYGWLLGASTLLLAVMCWITFTTTAVAP